MGIATKVAPPFRDEIVPDELVEEEAHQGIKSPEQVDQEQGGLQELKKEAALGAASFFHFKRTGQDQRAKTVYFLAVPVQHEEEQQFAIHFFIHMFLRVHYASSLSCLISFLLRDLSSLMCCTLPAEPDKTLESFHGSSFHSFSIGEGYLM